LFTGRGLQPVLPDESAGRGKTLPLAEVTAVADKASDKGTFG